MQMSATKKRIRKLGKAVQRGVTLVEVLIVVAIMAVIAGGATYLVFPEYKKARIKTSVVGATTIKQAAEVYRELESMSDACPTIQDLVSGKKIDASKTDDPWGMPYRIKCEDGGDIRVYSNGNDRKEGTPDDVKDNFKQSDIEKVAKL
ncbi:type II secretion system protein [Chondromyces apiculatus]|uniref:General secretion pathway protein G n=1 Tax=Chondromyces apiculatus DSM 436 TaxID=1192034 RepID=A0A017T2Y9_9BACT|nr:type II secretion system protein [Chondromyces apiculatus]EYF02921.1 general secretion pathway protein G [Chondromyces apiculatus DSM 436]